MDPEEEIDRIHDQIEQLRARLMEIETERCQILKELEAWEVDDEGMGEAAEMMFERASGLLSRKRECQAQLNLLVYVDPEAT